MPNDEPVYLVVGSDSLIGGALLRRLRSAGQHAVGTTRRRTQVDHSVYLDLAEDPDKWQPPSRVTAAIVCAGVTRLQACEIDPVTSAGINVEGVSALVTNLVRRGIFVIYLSSNQVFNGSKPFRCATDPRSPQSDYGRQKAETECRILRFGDSIAIVRFTKVLDVRPQLFLTWIEAMRNGNEIHPFSDMVIGPVPVELAAKGLHCVARARSPGLFQMSADRDITYEQAARHLARGLGIGEDLIQPIRTAESGFFTGPIPLHTTLDANRFRDQFGIVPPDTWSVVESILES
jgi:dTDP-4-dehydrorhamnose reductase